ncbi:hypothetical protein [uncultured Oscillibacter sp.]|uniref:hypothetical protein n=1 Tax=uncultured Oscillibacter sp. TaxID=876091 RepID=UPI00280BF358|nr:hypothetical protein [uncultured Oscillibacter sp.]
MKIYQINGQIVPRAEFFSCLRQDCSRIVSTTVISGWCGVDVLEFDEKRYHRCLRQLRQGHLICFFDRGRTYSLSSRR